VRNKIKIGEIAQIVRDSQLYRAFYEHNGLIKPAGKSESTGCAKGKTCSGSVLSGRAKDPFGFTLNEIKELLPLQHDPHATRADIKNRTLTKIDDVTS